jgi:hypothetical protein
LRAAAFRMRDIELDIAKGIDAGAKAPSFAHAGALKLYLFVKRLPIGLKGGAGGFKLRPARPHGVVSCRLEPLRNSPKPMPMSRS